MSEHTSRPNLTPYFAAKITAVALERIGSDRTPPTTQSMYTRARKGTIKTVEGTEKVMFDGNDFARWLSAYVNETPKTAIDVNELTDQYMS